MDLQEVAQNPAVAAPNRRCSFAVTLTGAGFQQTGLSRGWQQGGHVKCIYIESDLSSFEDFHDGGWFEKLFSTVDGTELESIVEDFAAHWWGASRSFVLPWLYVNGVYDAVDNIVPLADKSRQDLWRELLEVNAFKASLWKISEGAFCAIYYAYENLLVQMLSKMRGTPIRVTDRHFNKELFAVYGQFFGSLFWTGDLVSASRETRNCITHNGGKASDRLKGMKRQPRIENGDVLISASDVRTLYTALQLVVNQAVEQSLAALRGGDR
jgi:hypothetical protein